MSKQSLNTLKEWFKKGLKPLQEQFWHWMDSFWHKDESIPSANIGGLQELLDTKMDKKDVVAPEQVGVYDPDKNYVFDAQTAEYVSFSNPSSPDDQFKTEKFYRLKEDAPAGENPETHPAHWAYQGTTIGEITIDDVIGLREELDDIRENGGSGGTSDHSELTNRDAADSHPLSSITPAAGNANKIAVVSADGTVIGYTEFTAQQIVQLANIDVSDPSWLDQTSRLLVARKNGDVAEFEEAVSQLDKMAADTLLDKLGDTQAWDGDNITLTGENFFGELGERGQELVDDQGQFFICRTHINGTQGGNNGEAVWVRNRSRDCLNTIADAAIISALVDETGWDAVNNVKALTVRCKVGSWHTSSAGYSYFCFASTANTWLWRRIGQPETESYNINDADLISEIEAHDFATTPILLPVSTVKGYDRQEHYWDDGATPNHAKCIDDNGTIKWIKN